MGSFLVFFSPVISKKHSQVWDINLFYGNANACWLFSIFFRLFDLSDMINLAYLIFLCNMVCAMYSNFIYVFVLILYSATHNSI